MTSLLNVLIADDEDLARERLTRIINKLDGFTVSAQAKNGLDALEKARQSYPDIAVLDIRMPEMDGIEAAKKIAQLEPAPAIIFCTAYDEYALTAFQANAVGYVLKPAREADIAQALTKAQTLNHAHLKAIEKLQHDGSQSSKFVAHTWDGEAYIELADIFYFRAEHKYLNVIHKQGETLSNQTLKELEQLYAQDFIRTHRSVLVNKKHIKKLSKTGNGAYQLELSNGESVEVSRRHLSEVRAGLAIS